MTARALERAAWQEVLFGQRPKQSAVKALGSPSWPVAPKRVRVIRNHAIEPIETVLIAAGQFAGFDLELHPGAYSDLLGLDEIRPDDDAIVFWVDASRYQSDVSALLTSRVAQIRRDTRAPIAVMIGDPDTVSIDVDAVARDLEDLDVPVVRLSELCSDIEWWRPEMAEAAGTGLTSLAAARAGRTLGAVLLPALFGTMVKAIMVDIDNTLHAGVLGEDGLDGVVVTPAAAALQERLRCLKDDGVLLCAVSKNDPHDVADLFVQHPDYRLREHDFYSVRAGWGEKSATINDLIAELRIGVDTVLFIDDNPGELLAVELAIPGVRTMQADLDGAPDLVLRDFPGIRRFRVDSAASVRADDLHANAERSTLVAEGDFFNALEVVATVHLDDATQAQRVADLLGKTNQFNTSLARTPLSDVQKALTDSSSAVVTVHVRDRLSDSGCVSALLARRENDEVRVEELCISCRALGRRLESTIVFESLRASGLVDGASHVTFIAPEGPRNQPALDWLTSLDGATSSPGQVTIQAQQVAQFVPPDGLTLHVETS